MDLLDFSDCKLYFEDDLPAEAERLIALAASEYGEPAAELSLLRAHLHAPENLSVLVGLYRYYFYQHRLGDALVVAERAMQLSGRHLGLPADWKLLDEAQLGSAAANSFGLLRFYLLALKAAGAEQVVSVSAVGSLAADMHPGDIVLVDQFIDRTRNRPSTYFEDDGVVAHVGFSDPIDAALSQALHRAARRTGVRAHHGGTYVCIEGPQFSTRAESNLYRSWGAHVVGMTNLPEARLARECELPYATVALVTDYDCWKVDEEPVTVDAVIAVLKKNVAAAQAIVREVASNLPDPTESPATRALDHAILTPPERISDEAKARLRPLIGRTLGLV